MKTTYLKRFRQAFANHDWSRRERRAYARQWARSVRNLGSKWVLFNQPERRP